MSYDEFIKCTVYFEQRPIGWREDLRTAYLMNTFGERRKPTEIFPSVAAVFNKQKQKSPADSLKGSFLFSKMLGAKGGDKLDILGDL